MTQFKIFLQTLWKKNNSWDQLLGDEDELTWKNLINDWPEKVTEIPRLTIQVTESPQIHVFTDASTLAYSAAVYAKQGRDILNLRQISNRICKSKLGNYQQWWKGPNWLAGDERDWPLWEFNFKENDEEVNVIAKSRESTIARGSLRLLDASRFRKNPMVSNAKGDFTAKDYRIAVMLLIKQAQTERITEDEITKWNLFYDEEDR
ncbi:unnamed protein product, partial [Onchocerca ochengi]|uniref:RT_RNaseH_2 domain-containing protein n=1 Tax=Onchocerca ochengi TaxID=42157 RepID=A0A182EXT0_ONCOC